MLQASASIQGPLSISCSQGSFWPTVKIYGFAPANACPILLLFHHFGVSAVRTTTFRLLASRNRLFPNRHHVIVAPLRSVMNSRRSKDPIENGHRDDVVDKRA
jgi:hypothetical protein